MRASPFSLSLFLPGSTRVPSTLQCHWIDDPNISHSPYVTFHYARYRAASKYRASVQGELLQYRICVAYRQLLTLSSSNFEECDDDRVQKFYSKVTRSEVILGKRTFSFFAKHQSANCCSKNCFLSTPKKWKASRENVNDIKIDVLSN